MKIRAVIVEGEASEEAIAKIRAALAEPAFKCVYAPVAIAEVIRRVSYETGVSQSAIVSPGKYPRAVRSRFAVAWFAATREGHPAAQIARALNRTAKSARHMIERGAELADSDPAFAAMARRLAEHFYPGAEA